MSRACGFEERILVSDNGAQQKAQRSEKVLACIFLRYLGGVLVSNKDDSGLVATTELKRCSAWWEHMVREEMKANGALRQDTAQQPSYDDA
jgi:hypothetical protein